MPAMLRSLRSKALRQSQHEHAYTLVELLVGTVLTVIVVSSLAAIALISELKLGRESEVNQALRDNWGRAMTFIQNEAQHAYWIRTDVAEYPCEGQAPEGPLLVLDGPPNPQTPSSPLWQVVYGVRENTAGSKDWRGANRLVRCGPPFESLDRGLDPAQQKNAAEAANLTFSGQIRETVLVDQLAKEDPFQVALYDTKASRDRDAQVSLFLSRNTGASYPPANTFATSFQMQIRANRNPGFAIGESSCTTIADPNGTGNQVPPSSSNCDLIGPIKDSRGRFTNIKNYRLPATGTLRVNGVCDTCQGALSTSTVEVIYLNGPYNSFTTKQFAAPGQPNASGSCSRTSCYVSNGSQSVQIYDGNVLVFTDRVVRL